MLQPNPNIAKLDPDKHGGLNYAELKKYHVEPNDVIDFSVCTNPFGPPAGVRQAIKKVKIDQYPDSDATELIDLLAKKTGVTVSNIVAGNGTTELIRLVTQAYLGPGDRVLMSQPTYAEYQTASKLAGARVIIQKLAEKEDFRLNIEETLDLVKKHQPKVIFICNPNNPTGQYLNEDEILKILNMAADSLIILDEAYIRFTGRKPNAAGLIKKGNLMILRSMTKDYALPGLRLGYALACEPIITILKKIKPPWNVNASAQLAGSYVLQHEDHCEDQINRLNKIRNYLISELKTMGLVPLPTEANFFLVKVRNAASMRNALLRKGILVRDCASFGLPDYIRIATRTRPECRRLMDALKLLLKDEYNPNTIS
jgi:histidinol-phosphate aminotransferase